MVSHAKYVRVLGPSFPPARESTLRVRPMDPRFRGDDGGGTGDDGGGENGDDGGSHPGLSAGRHPFLASSPITIRSRITEAPESSTTL